MLDLASCYEYIWGVKHSSLHVYSEDQTAVCVVRFTLRQLCSLRRSSVYALCRKLIRPLSRCHVRCRTLALQSVVHSLYRLRYPGSKIILLHTIKFQRTARKNKFQWTRVRFEFLSAVTIRNTIFCDVTSCLKFSTVSVFRVKEWHMNIRNVGSVTPQDINLHKIDSMGHPL